MTTHDYQVSFSFGYCTITVHVEDSSNHSEEEIISKAADIINDDLGLDWDVEIRASDITLEHMGDWS